MKENLAALALMASLALAGCSAGNQSADATLSATATPSASPTATHAISSASPSASERKKLDAEQAWADDMINLFLNGNSKSSFDDFNEELPHHFVKSWAQEFKGVMSVTVSGAKWTQCEMDELAVTVMSTAGHETQEMKKVITHSDDKSVTGSTDRSGMNFGTPESC